MGVFVEVGNTKTNLSGLLGEPFLTSWQYSSWNFFTRGATFELTGKLSLPEPANIRVSTPYAGRKIFQETNKKNRYSRRCNVIACQCLPRSGLGGGELAVFLGLPVCSC